MPRTEIPIISREAVRTIYRFAPDNLEHVIYRKPNLDFIFPSMVRIAIERDGLNATQAALKSIKSGLPKQFPINGNAVLLKQNRNGVLGLLAFDEETKERVHQDRAMIHGVLGLPEPEPITNMALLGAPTVEGMAPALEWMRAHIDDPIRRSKDKLVLGEATIKSLSVQTHL